MAQSFSLTPENLKSVYGKVTKIYGPYNRAQDGRAIVEIRWGTKKKTSLLGRVLLELKIGRQLTSKETVDHKDGNPLNDDPKNLQVLSRGQNALKAIKQNGKSAVYLEYSCRSCGAKVSRREKYMRQRGGAEVFCSLSCRGNFYGNGYRGGRYPTKCDYDQVYAAYLKCGNKKRVAKEFGISSTMVRVIVRKYENKNLQTANLVR